MDYKTPTSRMTKTDVSLVDELNTFYIHFKAVSVDTDGARNAKGSIC